MLDLLDKTHAASEQEEVKNVSKAFDPTTFNTPKNRSTTLCNSEHPLAPYLGSLLLKRIPSKNPLYKDFFYVVVQTKQGEKVMTFCGLTQTLQLHCKTLKEFKAMVINGQNLESTFEAVDIDPVNKWIANDIRNYLQDEDLI